MTDNEMRMAIAEAHGFERWEQKGKVVLAKPDSDTAKYWRQCGAFLTAKPVTHSGAAKIPNYPEDLNAMRSVEDALNPAQQIEYTANLWETNPKSAIEGYDWLQSALHQETWWTLTHATARQRAIAFLKTIGKYTNNSPT